MKLFFGSIIFVIGMLLGHAQHQTVCMDPNANVPIDCSLVK